MTFEEYRHVIAENAKLDVSNIQENSSFRDDLGIDSLQLVNVIVELTERFNIELHETESNSDLQTVGKLFKLFRKEDK